MVKGVMMKFSHYVAIREQERNATIQALLVEIQTLESQLEELAIAYQELLEGTKHHVAGFKPKGDEDE